MFRVIDTRFWTDPKIKQLPPNGKLFAAYLITNEHTNVSGLYYLPRVLMSHETGITLASDLDILIMQVSQTGFAFFDAEQELVFVVSMFRHQGFNPSMVEAARKQIEKLPKSDLSYAFLQTYPQVAALLPDYPIKNQPVNGWKQYLIDRVSTGSRHPVDISNSISNRNRDQKTGKIKGENNGGLPRSLTSFVPLGRRAALGTPHVNAPFTFDEEPDVTLTKLITTPEPVRDFEIFKSPIITDSWKPGLPNAQDDMKQRWNQKREKIRQRRKTSRY